MQQPQMVSDLDITFATDVSHLMPDYDAIPDEFKKFHNPYRKAASKWHYEGLKRSTLSERKGVDARAAIRHLSAILSSFEPKHEHKLAAVAYLMSQWFELKSC